MFTLLSAPAAARDRGGPLGVSASAFSSCARFGARSVCWGNGYYPLFGASEATSGQPVGDDADEIPGQPEIQWQTTDRLLYMQTEYQQRCALFANGGVRCMAREGRRCAQDTTAIVGGTAPDYFASVPFIAFQPTAPPVTQLSTGYNHNCAVFEGGGIRCWGVTADGVLGLDAPGSFIGDVSGETANIVALTFSDTVPATLVSAGASQTCALFANGRIRCWGKNASVIGTAQSGTVKIVETLVYIVFSDTVPAVNVDLSYANHACAIFSHPAGQKLKW
eukprot:TRINITY_DN4285_c1_g1_i2.p1 TRINITY_DN4285_c1_g1~~TRINITY_DN4285_c1_g1_i2.p1  ORF type:complete len:302 (+),score=61.96 TRINITY_DN4285_c1_g1_i2:74-907(+)